MSKANDNTIKRLAFIGNAFKEHFKVSDKLTGIERMKCFQILKHIVDSVGVAYFDGSTNVVMSEKGKDSGFFSTVSNGIKLLKSEQSEACIADFEAIEDERWSENNKVSIGSMILSYSAKEGLYSLDMGSTFKSVRPVFQYIADNYSRKEVWDILHSDQCYSKFKEYKDERDGNAEETPKEETPKEETKPSPNDDPNGTTVVLPDNKHEELVAAYKELGGALANTDMNLAQALQVSIMITDVTNHVASLNCKPEDIPQTLTLPVEEEKKTASK